MRNKLLFTQILFSVLLLAGFITSNTLQAQSFRTPAFTGAIGDFNVAERFAAAAGNTTYAITFDATYMYLGAFRTSGSFGGADNFAVYIDADPRNTLASGNGSTTGKAFNSVTPTLAFNADYSAYMHETYTDPINRYNAGWASTGITPTSFANTTSREVRIALSDLGNPASVYVSVFMGYAGGIFSSAPGTDVATSATPNLTGFFGSFPVYKSGITPISFRTQNTSTATGGGLAISNATVLSTAGDFGDITLSGASTFTLVGNTSYTGTLTIGSGTTGATRVGLSTFTLTVGGRGIGGTAGAMSVNGSSGAVFTTGAGGTVAFLGAGSISGANIATTPLFPASSTVTIGGAVDFGNVGATPFSGLTGTLQINANGSVLTNPPSYNTGSTLIYNTGTTYTAGSEWTTASASAKGVPQAVKIQNNTALNFGASTAYRQANLLVTIASGSSLTLSSAAGGDLKIGGGAGTGLTNSGTFSTNGRALWWVGTATGTYTKTGGGTDNIDIFIHNTSSTLNLAGSPNATNWTLVSTGTTTASCLQMQSSGSLYLDVNTLTIPAGGTIYVTGASSQIQGATYGVLNFAGVGYVTPVTSGTSTLSTTLATRVQTGSQLIIGGTAATPALSVTGVFQLNQGGYVDNAGGTGIPVKYISGSTLVYNHTTGAYGVQATEWPATNSPTNVTVNANGGTGITFATNNITARTLAGTLTLNHDIDLSGSGTPNLTTLNTIANATSTVKGTGNFTHSASGSFTTTNTGGINGTITTSGTVTLPTTTSFTFNGTAPQVTGALLPATVAALSINNTAGGTNGVTISNNALTISGVTTLTAGALILPTAAGNLVTFTGNISTPTSGGSITGSSTSNISTAGTIAGTANALTFTSGAASLKNWTHTTTTNFGSTSGGLNSVVSIYGTFSTTALSPYIYVGPSGGFIFTTGSSFIDNGSAAGTAFLQTTATGGSFTVQSGASFTTAHASGLNATAASGAVQTTNRTFSGGANYTFASTSAAQSTGNALDATGGTGQTGPITGNVVFNNNNSTGVTLTAGTTITVNSPGAITVGTGSTAGILTIPATSFINGTGNFSLLGNGATSGSSLSVANSSGINGAILSSGTVSLTNGSNNNTNFTFNGVVLAQVTGSMLPATINSLTINNATSGSATATPAVLLSGSTTVNGTLTFTNGHFSINGQSLTANGAITTNSANKLVGTATSNFIVGGSGTIGGSSSSLFGTSGGGTLQNFTINRSGQTVTAGTTLTVGGTFSLSNGALAMSNNTLTLNGDITLGSGTLTAAATPIVIGGSGAITGSLTATSAPLAFSQITMNRSGATLTLGSNATVSSATGLTLTAGNIALGSFNLTSTSSTGQLGAGSTSSMIVATGSGQAYNTIPTSGFIAQTCPVGDGTNYTPVILTFTANATGGTVGVRTTASAHTSINSGSTPSAYISRYWTFSNTLGATYTYSGTFRYISPGDVTGPEANLKLSRWNGSTWTEFSGSSVASPVLSSGTLTQATGPLTGNDYTGRVNAAAINYVWNGVTDDWNTATNWSPNGVPTALDNVTVDGSLSAVLCSINSGSYSANNFTLNGTGSFAMASGTSLTVNGTVTYGGSATAALDCASTFNYGGGSQTVAALYYGNLNLTGGARVLASTGTIGICGTFTPGAGGFTNTGSTIDFNGTGSQSIPAFSYNNLTSSNSGARTLAGSGSVAVAGTFIPGSNVYTITGSTIDFSSSGSQTIPAFNYNNITNTGGGARILASSGVVGIAASFTPGAGAYTVTGSTVDYNGTAGFTMSTFTYNNLTISGNKGAGTVSFGSGTITIGGVLSYTATNAKQIAGSGTVVFNSASSQTIPALNYYNLNLTGGTRELASSGTIGLAGPTFTPGSGPFTVTGSTVNFSNGTGFTLPALTPAATNNYNNLTISGAGSYPQGASLTIGGNFNQSTGTYTIAGASAYSLSVNGNFTQSGGTFTVTSGAAAGTMTVGGSFTQSAGTFNVTGSSASKGATVTVAGSTSLFSVNMSPSSGNAASLLMPSPTNTILFQANGDATFTGSSTTTAFDWMTGGSTGSIYNITFGIKGNFNWSNTSGRPYTTGSGTAKGFVFNGTGTILAPQTLTYSGITVTYGGIYAINSSTVVKLLTNVSIGTNTAPYNTFTVNGTLDAQSAVISGGNATVDPNNTGFTLAADATLMTKSATGVNGNITTALKNFSPTANYVFNGTADQVTGALLTTAKNIDLANTGGKVSLSNGVAVSGTVTVPASNKLGVSTYAITGAGNFNLQSGGTLYTANTAGINGSIGVGGTKTFDAAANYVFNGTADQVTGALLTAANYIDLANTAGKVALSGNVALSGILTIPTGNKLDAASYVISGAGDIDLQGGGTLFSAHTGGLNGNIATSGVLSSYSTAANYTFNGSSAQVTGALLPATVNNLTIDNAAGVKLSNTTQTVAGTMLINSGKLFTLESGKQLTVSGTLTNNGGTAGLVIKSDDSGTGSLITSSTPNANVERYLAKYNASGDNMYHFMSSPVAAQAIQNEFVASTPTTGEDFYSYSEILNSWINTRAIGGAWNTGFESTFTLGKGYMVAYPAHVTKNFAGTLNAGNKVLTCTKTTGKGEGWNLLGNPFSSAINWTAVTLGAGMDNALYYYDNASANYLYYIHFDGITIGSGQQYIPAMQGFMVHANTDGATVTLLQTARTHLGQSVFYKSTNSVPGSLSLKVSANGYEDEAFIHFNQNATTAFDGKYDAFKLKSYSANVPSIYTVASDGNQLAINGLPEVEENSQIPVYFVAGKDGQYTLTANLQNLPEAHVYLVDNKLSKTQNLSDNPVYTFAASTTDQPNRFKLTFNSVGISEPAGAEPLHVYMDGTNLNVIGVANANAEIRVTNMIGQVVLRSNTNGNTLSVLNANKLQNGVYVVSLISGSKVVSTKIVVSR